MSPLEWPDCRNVRDLGGLPTSGPGVTRYGELIRSDNLDRLTQTGIAAVHAAGVGRIVDVRSSWENENFPSAFANTTLLRNRPISDPDAPDLSDHSLAEQFIWVLDHGRHLVASAIAEIADAPPGAVVVHCHAGKDRAGLIIALVLDLVGVSRVAIAADYAILGDGSADVRIVVGTTDSGKPELEAPQEATILRTLDHVDETYGSVAHYLTDGGLTPGQQNAIRGRLIC
jgi:protein tyrosine/serine phosphatase